jgi:small subunit ribosomal protein S1
MTRHSIFLNLDRFCCWQADGGADAAATDEASSMEQVAAAAPHAEEVDASSMNLMEELNWTEEYDIVALKSNTVVPGVVLNKRNRSLTLDIGAKFEGSIEGREVERLGDSFELIEEGQTIELFVLRTDDNGQPRVSIIRARQEKDWLRAEELLESKEIVSSKVIDFNRGGVLVEMGLIRGFIPASHLSLESQMEQVKNDDPAERFQPLIGRTLQVKVIDIERKRNRLILSEKEAMREIRNQRKDAILDELEVGEVRDGVVSSLADFGAFVNIGGADGLIHVSELSWSMVNHPSEVLNVGQKVQIKVISVEKERKRIGLSLRQLQPRPWDTLAERYKEGDLVRAVITRIKDFGAFARLVGEPVEGLIHISEMSHEHIERSDQVVTVGEEYEVRVIRLDTQRRRMGLSIKQADLDWALAPEDAALETEAPTEEAAPEIASVPTEVAAEAVETPTPMAGGEAVEPAEAEAEVVAPAAEAVKTPTSMAVGEAVEPAEAEVEAVVPAAEAVVEAVAPTDAGPQSEVPSEAEEPQQEQESAKRMNENSSN